MKAKMQQILSFIRRNKLATKVISFTLSLVLVFYVIPSSIYAEAAELLSSVESGSENTENTENTNTEDSAPGNNLEINNESDYTVPLYEAEELREESVKHFKLSDGSYMAAQYPSAVHYADENGIWQDIDNSLSESGAEYSNSNARIKFAKKITGNSSLFTLHDSGTKITLSLTGAIKGTTGAVTNNSDAESDTELQKMLNLENLSSSIIYRDILDGIDLEYIATSMNVKENIIVKESKDSYSYSFELKLNGLGATLSESGDILITVEGTDEIKYVIPAPVVYDSSGTHAPEDKAYYTLTHENGKKYTLTITADSEWMNSDERAFPITIDPAIVSARSSIVDTYISLDSPETYNHLATSLYVSDREYTYVKCEELPTISPNAYISNATVTMRSSNAPHAVYVGAYAVITDWDTSLSWNTHTDSTSPAGQIDERVIDYAIVSGYDFFSWNITSLARKWYAENNYGVAFKSLLDDNNSVSFFSENFTVNSTYCPTVTITYRDMKGIEDYWSYSSHSAGVAGNGYVNLATGNLVLDIPTLTTTDGLFRYTPTLYYNSSLRNEEYIYGPTKSAYTTSYAPIGFKLNICETIVEEVYSNSDVTNESYFIHVDEDGTEHAYYAETDTENDEKYYDEDGLGKTMTVSDTTIEITDSSHIIKRFFKMSSTPSTNVYSAWFLSEIEDAAGNKLIFTFDSSYRPTKINLRPNGATSNTPLMTLLYTLDGKLCAIYDFGTQQSVVLKYTASSDSSTIVYSGGKYLRSIEYCYFCADPGDQMMEQELNDYARGEFAQGPVVDTSITYSYDIFDGVLSLIKNQNTNHILEYSWYQSRISGILEIADNDIGQSINYEYFNSCTDVFLPGSDGIINSNDDIVTRYTFDSFGRTISCYSKSKDNTEVYGAVMGAYDNQDASKNSISERTVLGISHPNLLFNSNFENSSDGESIDCWYKSDNVEKNEAQEMEVLSFGSLEFSPTLGNDAYIEQLLFLKSGEYTLTVNHRSKYSANVNGFIQVIDAIDDTVIKAAQLNLNTNSTLKEDKTILIFTNPNDIQVNIRLVFTAESTPNANMDISVQSMKLEKGNTSSEYSFVDCGDFGLNITVNNGGVVSSSNCWENSDGSEATIYTNTNEGIRALQVGGNGFEESYAKQILYQADTQTLSDADISGNLRMFNHQFVVSGFAKTNWSIPTSPFRLRVDVTYFYGFDEGGIVVSYYYNFVPDCNEWQYVSGTFSLNEDIPPYLCVSSIVLYCEYSYQTNDYALFDNISVSYNGLSRTYNNEYNSDGKIIKSETEYYTEYYEYNEDGNISRIANSDGELTDYVYSTDNPNLLSTVLEYTYTYNGSSQAYPYTQEDPDIYISKTQKLKTDYTYNSYGQITETKTYEPSDGTPFTVQRYTYENTPGSKLFGLIISEQNTANSDTKYFYENYSGRLIATVNSYSGRGYAYTYDYTGRVTRIDPVKYTSSSNSYNTLTSYGYTSYVYDNGFLSSISTSVTTYNFTYNDFGNTSEIKVGNNTLASYEYEEYNGSLKKVTYGNGFNIEYVYNGIGQLSELKYNGSTKYVYEYTSNGKIYKITDGVNNKTTVYNYDLDDRVIGVKEYDSSNDEELLSQKIEYNPRSLVSFIGYNFNYNTSNGSYSDNTNYEYIYHNDGRLKNEYIYSASIYVNVTYGYDALDRISSVVYNGSANGNTNNFSNTVTYTYCNNSTYGENGLVKTYTSTVGDTTTAYAYYYDANGNIGAIRDSSDTVTYTYDDIGQLTVEKHPLLGKNYYYSYDNAGNIIQKSITTTATSSIVSTYFTYSDSEWGDLLVAVGNKTITYDAIGNPLKYYNGFNFTWQGRRLTRATNSNGTYNFSYNDEGLRILRYHGGLLTRYYYSDSLLVKEESALYIMVYIYDAIGSPIGFRYRAYNYAPGTWDVYFYEKNLQGDIVAIYNAAGVKLISYMYDAWGNFTINYHNGGASTTAINNPYTYRGYYYDKDLGLYYLQSRYYDANICRFINPDKFVSTGQGLTGCNMFAYCGNNPVNRVDPTGDSWIAIIVLVVVLTITLTSCSQQPTEEQVNQAKAAADNAKYEYEKDTNSISITIDLSADDQQFDAKASDVYFDRLYENMVAKAKAKNVPLENLMTREHIVWEYDVHKFFYKLPIEKFKEPCKKANLNVKENWRDLFRRGWGYLFND